MSKKIKREIFSIVLTLIITLPFLFLKKEPDLFDYKNIILSALLFFLSGKVYDYVENKSTK